MDGRSNAEHLTDGIARLAELVMSEETVQTVLDLICLVTRSTIPAADAVSITARRNDRFVTLANTDDVVAELDLIQYKRTGGPCVEAMRSGVTVHVQDLEVDGRWDRFATAASESGFRSVLSIPLRPVDVPIGVLNIFSTTADGFDDENASMAESLAHQAAIAMANSGSFVESEQANEQLREALSSRDKIGQAKGILMERNDLTEEQAFSQMRAESQRTNRKLREIAEEIIQAIHDRHHRD